VKLHTVFITYNRLELTKRAIESYLETTEGHMAIPLIVDNDSTDGTRDWIRDSPYDFLLLDENMYPGFATNRGWEMIDGGSVKPEYLHRADNDWEFLPGWCDEVEARFSENSKLGQLGMRTDEQEGHNEHNVGGNCVIRRELWDQGLRYDERPWTAIKRPGYTEDSYMSPEVLRMGWEWGRVKRVCIEPLSVEDPYDPYYLKSWEDRGILQWAKDAYGIVD
jgi:GT2 family glycosyltransferase